MEVVKLTVKDYKKISKVHTKAFEGFFLTSLGDDFLKTYYKSCLGIKETIAFGIFNDNQNLVGFATGTVISKGYHKKVFFRNLIGFLKSLLKPLIGNPKVFIRLLKNYDKVNHLNDDAMYAELLSIGVLPEYNGKGLGGELLLHFENEVRSRGALKVALTTDFYNNEKAIGFYRKLGYTIFYEFIAYPKRKMIKMIKEL